MQNLKNIPGEMLSLAINTAQGIIYFHKNHMETLRVYALFLRHPWMSTAVKIWSKQSSYGMTFSWRCQITTLKRGNSKTWNMLASGLLKFSLDRRHSLWFFSDLRNSRDHLKWKEMQVQRKWDMPEKTFPKSVSTITILFQFQQQIIWFAYFI